MSTHNDIRTRVIAIVKDGSGKLLLLPDHDITDPVTHAVITAGRLNSQGALTNPDDYDRKITAALNRYSKFRPDINAIDITGNGTHDYDLPSGWSHEFSMIASLEYPMGNMPETILDLEDFGIYQTPTGQKMRIRTAAPRATEKFRLTYTVLRSATTVPDIDVDAFCNLAASMCLEDLANAFAQTSDPTIDADSVNYRTKSAEFAARAKRLFQLYKDHIGIKEDDTTPPATAVADFDNKYPGGSARLTHPKWARERR